MALAAAVTAAPAPAAFSGANGDVLVAATGDPPAYVSAGGTRQPVPGYVRSGQASLSADGLREVYANANGLVVRQLAGGQETTIVGPGHTPLAPIFSPDGSEVAWQEGGDILHARSDGSSGPVTLASQTAGEHFGRGIAWTPDGAEIVVGTSFIGGGACLCSTLQVVAFDVTTKARRAITPLRPFADHVEEQASRPDVAGDGSSVVFLQDVSPKVDPSFTAMATAPLAGGAAIPVRTEAHAALVLPRYAPDGTQIVYGLRTAGGALQVRATGAGDHLVDDNGGLGYGDLDELQWLPITCGTADADGDGLCDSWETQGIDADGNGTVDLKLYDEDANGVISATEEAKSDHKDLFVEIDPMAGQPLDPSAIADVKAAFANAPVANPDGTTGIRLHVLIDGEVLPHFARTGLPGACGSTPGPGDGDFDALKAQHFGTAAERLAAPVVLEAKRLAFRYTIWADGLANKGGTSGCAELPGNDFIITLGTWNGGTGGTKADQEGTFMHELGHTLGLRHGGLDDINCKPNYLSVMNYALQIEGLPVSGRPLDYSRAALPTLDEGNLDESLGIQGPAGLRSAFGPSPMQVFDADAPVNWNGNAVTGDAASADINHNDDFGCTGRGTVLVGFNDWPNLRYDFRSSPDFADGRHATAQTQEVTAQQADANRGTGTPAAPGGPGMPPPGATTACHDGQAPTAALTAHGVQLARRALRVSGTARDTTACSGAAPSGVARVEVSLARRAGRRCRFVGASGRLGRARSCAHPVLLRARGTRSWTLTLRRPPSGRYTLSVQARDTAGNAGTISTRTLVVRRGAR